MHLAFGASLARVVERVAVVAMGKLLKKYAHGRGLPENSLRTALHYDEERKKRDDARRRSGGSTSAAGGQHSRASSHASSGSTKRWKSRGGAKPRLIRALRVSAHGHRALTKQEVDALIAPVLQPVRAKYGGQGFAKQSTFVNIASDDFLSEFEALFDEHVDGFNGKSYVKMGKSQEDMLWKQKLREKAKANEVRASDVRAHDAGEVRAKKKKMKLVTEPTVRVDVDMQAQAIAAYRALKAKKAAAQNQKRR